MVDKAVLAKKVAAVRDAVARIAEVLPPTADAFVADRTVREIVTLNLFLALAARGVIDPALATRLRAAAGLRNLIRILRSRLGIPVLLVAAFPQNPGWHVLGVGDADGDHRADIREEAVLWFAPRRAIIDSTGAPMAQLIVRNVDPAVVRALRQRAAKRGRSAEAEHREILKESLLSRGRPRSLKTLLLDMPDVGDDEDFARPRAKGRRTRV